MANERKGTIEWGTLALHGASNIILLNKQKLVRVWTLPSHQCPFQETLAKKSEILASSIWMKQTK